MGLSTDDKGHSQDMASECNGMRPLPGAGSGQHESSGLCLTHLDEDITMRLHLKDKLDIAT